VSFQTGQCPNHVHATCVDNGCRIVDGEYICGPCVSRCVRYVLETCSPAAEQVAEAAGPPRTADSSAGAVMPTEVFIVAEQPDPVYLVGVHASPFTTSLVPDAPQPLQIGYDGTEVLLRMIHAAPVFDLHTLQPRLIKHPDIGLGVAPGGPAVAGRRTNAPPRRTGVPATGEPKIGPGVRFFPDRPVPCREGSKTGK
jgi:hypothetical protein